MDDAVPPRAKRLRADGDGDAALRVFASAQLFPLLPQWATGWPARLRDRWREIQAAMADRHSLRARRGFALSKERQMELFMRELMLRGDVETLRLAAASQWRDRERGAVHELPVKDLQFAIRSGSAETVRWAFETSGTKVKSEPFGKCAWYWLEALTHFPGHCAVLDVLKEFARPPEDMWKYKTDEITSPAVAKWIAESLGHAHLPSVFICHAAKRGELALVEYLSSVSGQDVQLAIELADSYPPEIAAFLKSKAGAKAEV